MAEMLWQRIHEIFIYLFIYSYLHAQFFMFFFLLNSQRINASEL